MTTAGSQVPGTKLRSYYKCEFQVYGFLSGSRLPVSGKSAIGDNGKRRFALRRPDSRTQSSALYTESQIKKRKQTGGQKNGRQIAQPTKPNDLRNTKRNKRSRVHVYGRTQKGKQTTHDH